MYFWYNDPIVQRIWPPSWFGCGCRFVQLSIDDALKETGKSKIEDVIQNGSLFLKEIDESGDFKIEVLKKWDPLQGKNYHPRLKKALSDSIKDNIGKFLSNEPVQTSINNNLDELGIENIMDNIPDYSEAYENQQELINDYIKKLDKDISKTLNDYKGVNYADINKDLRRGKTDSMLYKSGKKLNDNDMNYEFKGDDIPMLYRGESFWDTHSYNAQMDKLKMGQFEPKQFFSTSAEVQTARSFASQNSNKIFYKINMPKKYKAGIGTSYEYEVILRVESKFKVKKIDTYNYEGKTINFVEMDYLGE